MKAALQLHQNDNVAIALQPLKQGQEYRVSDKLLVPSQDIQKGHKVALKDIECEQSVVKYGSPIGHVTSSVKAGDWIHVNNLKTNLSDELSYQFTSPFTSKRATEDDSPAVQIYRRSNGDVAIRNELWIIPTVGCVNGMAKLMVQEFLQQHPTLAIDGVHVFPHQFGCSQLGDDLENTKVLLQNMALHPNSGGVLVVGLGCENNQVSAFKRTLGDHDEERVKFLISQHFKFIASF